MSSLTKLIKQVRKPIKKLAHQGQTQFAELFMKKRHRFMITGLSRSGKSMLFTSLMSVLRARSEQRLDCLPLLKNLPVELIERMWVSPLPGYTAFPVDQHLADLAKQQWPAPTEQAYGFSLTVRLKETNSLAKHLLPHQDIVFEFIDYPGEWLTDMPMLKKDFVSWSDSAFAQQVNPPQKHYAAQWHQFVTEFDFDQAVSEQAEQELISHYLNYIRDAKKAGISLLQPGSFLLDATPRLAEKYPFTPLPTHVSSDPSHPWTQRFTANYRAFQSEWLQPLRNDIFKETDKQIILVDLFEGLNHSRSHLAQLKETMSHLADLFIYGNRSWLSKAISSEDKISQVAFVATKADLIPDQQRANLTALLEDVCSGASAKLASNNIDFAHFLVSAIHVTDPGADEQRLRYTNQQGQYLEVAFEAIPTHLKDLSQDEHFPLLQSQVPPDYLSRMINGRGLDRLLQYLLN